MQESHAELLDNVMNDVLSTPTIEQMLHNVWLQLFNVFKCGSVALISFEGNAYRVVISRGLSNEYIKGLIARSSHPVVEEVGKTCKPLVIDEKHPFYGKEGFMFEKDFKKLVAVPMRIGKECNGMAFMDLDDVRKKVWKESTVEPRPSFSAGIVSYPEHRGDERSLINEAEQLIYKCRRNKGNQVLKYGS